MKRLLLLFLLLLPLLVFAQTITYDEFLDVAKASLNMNAVKELRPLFPQDFAVTALDIGDFSGDNKNDFALAIKPHKSNRKIVVYLFCDSLSHYSLIYTDTLEFVILPIEIGFSISKGVCFITQKIKDKNWAINGYTYLRNELAVYDDYNTDVKVVRRFQIGEEVYNNYSTLHSFVGYYDVNTLSDYKKNNFLCHPVYSRKRNIYESFRRDIVIDDSWKWDINDSLNKSVYGKISTSTDQGSLVIDLRLNEAFLKTVDSMKFAGLKLFFDRSTIRLKDVTRRSPQFRDQADRDIGQLEIRFKKNNPDSSLYESLWGLGFIKGKDDGVRLSYISDNDLLYRIKLPMNLLSLQQKQNELGFFIQLEFHLKNGQRLVLSNSNGYAEDPSSYGRLVFLRENEYYGSVYNHKFSELEGKLIQNGFGGNSLP